MRSRRTSRRTSACRWAGPGELCDFAHPLDYIGFDGGGGIGSGPGMAVGAALALRDEGSDRLPVAVLGDGDYLMGLTALWTGVHYRVPVLIVVANNESFFNDELHQERMARLRGRPVENRWIGLRMSEPAMDLAQLARGQGAQGYGPVRTADELVAALAQAVADVRAGARRRRRRARRAGIFARGVELADATCRGEAMSARAIADPAPLAQTRGCRGSAGSTTAGRGTRRFRRTRDRRR